MNQVNLTRRYYVSIDKLWDALAQGFLLTYTGTIKEKTSQDFRKGGKIHAEWADACGGDMDGEYLAVDPKSHIAFTWKTAALKEPTKVSIHIRQIENYCELTLVHDFPSGTDTKDYDFGWDDAMYDLKKHVYRA